MRFFDAAAVDAALAYPALVDILEGAFRKGAIAPLRHHHAIALEGRPEATLLLMPAWEASAPGGQPPAATSASRRSACFPTTHEGKPAVLGTYLLASAETGETLAVIDATRLTAWRTAAASALASRYLSRPDASRLLMVGAGALAPSWSARTARCGRSARSRSGTVRRPRPRPWSRHWPRGLDSCHRRRPGGAVRGADIVSTATFSAEPLIRAPGCAPGAHVDCVGAYGPSMRETDDEVVRRARIFVDTRTGAFAEAGDILQPLQAGVIGKEAVLGDLYDLTRGTVAGRGNARGDHPLQVGRRLHRGPGRRHRRLRQPPSRIGTGEEGPSVGPKSSTEKLSRRPRYQQETCAPASRLWPACDNPAGIVGRNPLAARPRPQTRDNLTVGRKGCPLTSFVLRLETRGVTSGRVPLRARLLALRRQGRHIIWRQRP